MAERQAGEHRHLELAAQPGDHAGQLEALVVRRQPDAGPEQRQRDLELAWLDSRLQGLELRAENDGRVGEILVAPGENVGPGTPLLRVESDGEAWVRLAACATRFAADAAAPDLLLATGVCMRLKHAKVAALADACVAMGDRLVRASAIRKLCARLPNARLRSHRDAAHERIDLALER